MTDWVFCLIGDETLKSSAVVLKLCCAENQPGTLGEMQILGPSPESQMKWLWGDAEESEVFALTLKEIFMLIVQGHVSYANM